MFYDSLLDGTGDCNSGDGDEVVAAGMANAGESVHLWKSGVRSLQRQSGGG